MPAYGVNPVGLKRRTTFEELLNTDNLKRTSPERPAAFIRNSPLITQFDHFAILGLDEYIQREMVECKDQCT